ncbi:MAG: roadblock/LC7 domain-containing protein [Candidatus Zixiibacteriota bacterium]
MAEIIEILDKIVDENKDVRSAFIASTEGFLIEGTSTNATVDLAELAAEVIPHVDEMMRLSDDYRFGDLELAMVEFMRGIVIVAKVSDDAIMVISSRSSDSLGKLRIRVKKAVSQIIELI